jgi:hypothetical protein
VLAILICVDDGLWTHFSTRILIKDGDLFHLFSKANLDTSGVPEQPLEGCQSTDQIIMPQLSESWQSVADRQYFLKLADGNYARMHVAYHLQRYQMGEREDAYGVGSRSQFGERTRAQIALSFSSSDGQKVGMRGASNCIVTGSGCKGP